MTSTGRIATNRQLLALMRLRWRMIRSAPMRWAIVLIGLLPVALILVGLLALQGAPAEQRDTLALATPTFYVGFVVLAILAPLVSGGGYELFPADELVPFNVRAATVFRGTLLLAPVNLAWMINVIALFVVTGFATGAPAWAPTSRSLLVVGVFVTAATVLGHTLGWFVMGVRQTRRGRWVTNTLGVLTVFAGLLVFWTDNVVTLLDNSPTTDVLLAAYAGYQSNYSRWAVTVVVLAVTALILVAIGDAVTSWALRRPGDHADRSSSRSLPRRKQAPTTSLALLAMDHASLWRSTPLRRGVLVLVIVPGAIAALAGMSWQSLILVPGLIAAGAGLLFGINAFTLDSKGSVWLATLPGWADPAFTAKSLIFLEVALAAVLSAWVGGSIRAPAPVSAAEVTASLASAVCCACVVVALGMRSSVRQPHRAELQGPRDTPATPGVMAAQSVRFAVVTTFTSLYFAVLALASTWWVPVAGAIPVLVFAYLHWQQTRSAWNHPHVRSHVVLTVASG